MDSGRPIRSAYNRIGVEIPKQVSGSGKGQKRTEAKNNVETGSNFFVQLYLKVRHRFQAWVTRRMAVTETNQVINNMCFLTY